MKILHTADWHLGRTLHRAPLLEDQHHALTQICELARSERPDCVLIAGDVYDRSVPPAEAVNLLNWALEELASSLGLPVIIIAGNHDSGPRLDFGRNLLSGSGLHVFGAPNSNPGCVTLADQHGPVNIWALPWIGPLEARHCFGCGDVQDHQGALKLCIDGINTLREPGARHLLVAHAFVGGAAVCEQSERKPMVGDGGRVDADLFDGFDYVALGHLHRPQQVGRDSIRYSGSPLAYSFDPAEGEKCVKLVDLGPDGRCSIETVPIAPRRPVRVLSGPFEELLTPSSTVGLDDYLCIEITDSPARLDPHRRLQDVYPNLLQLRFTSKTSQAPADTTWAQQTAERGDLELFTDFYRDLLHEDMEDQELTVLQAQLEAFEAQEREAIAQ